MAVAARRMYSKPHQLRGCRPSATGEALQVQFLHLGPGPRRPAQELQAGGDARVVGEAADRDSNAHRLPADAFDECEQHLFKRDAVEGIARLGQGHWGLIR